MVDINILRKTIDYIEDNLTEKIELDDIANNAYISKFHYHRIFHSVVGITIMEYMRKRRLSEAAKELNETKIKIVDIALKYQFSSPEAFSRAFKKMFGISPEAYRRIKPTIHITNRINIVQLKSCQVLLAA